jgi:hypothetical protein
MPSQNGQGEIYISFYLLASSVVLSSFRYTTAVVSSKLNKTGSVKVYLFETTCSN